jgi:hypothetical protein
MYVQDETTIRRHGMIPSTDEFDAELLHNLIQWAERDSKFESWGFWHQSVWGILKGADKRAEKVARKAKKKGIVREVNVCGTAFCMAGQTVVQKGYRLMFDGVDHVHAYGENTNLSGIDQDLLDTDGDLMGTTASTCIEQEPTGEYDEKGRELWRDVPGASEVSISDTARRELGLHPAESGVFFEADNNLDTLKELANGFCEARNLPFLFPSAGVRNILADIGAVLEVEPVS